MRNASNDNDTWQSLAAATARVVSKLEKQKDTEGADDGAADQERESGEEERRNYVNHRLRELAAFEARARGIRKRP